MVIGSISRIRITSSCRIAGDHRVDGRDGSSIRGRRAGRSAPGRWHRLPHALESRDAESPKSLRLMKSMYSANAHVPLCDENRAPRRTPPQLHAFHDWCDRGRIDLVVHLPKQRSCPWVVTFTKLLLKKNTLWCCNFSLLLFSECVKTLPDPSLPTIQQESCPSQCPATARRRQSATPPLDMNVSAKAFDADDRLRWVAWGVEDDADLEITLTAMAVGVAGFDGGWSSSLSWSLCSCTSRRFLLCSKTALL